MKKSEVSAKKAPAAIGPYSQAVKVGDFIFCSGQVGKDPETNSFVKGGIEFQTRQVLENLKAVLEGAGANLSDVVKTTVYLKDVADFPKMNEIYASYFQKPYPARATVEVARLPQDALIEVECIACISEPAYAKASAGKETCCGGGNCDCNCS